jgi:hypothetical protein
MSDVYRYLSTIKRVRGYVVIQGDENGTLFSPKYIDFLPNLTQIDGLGILKG